MISPDRANFRATGSSRGRMVAAVTCCALIAVALVQFSTVTAASASGRSGPPPSCPPDCGKVAAGDPLLIPYVTVNPGAGWLALPASGVRSYVDALKQNLDRGTTKGILANVAAAKWTWINNQFSLLIVLVSSGFLGKLHLASPSVNAQDLCEASKGAPRSQLRTISGIPGSVSGLCSFKSGSSFKGATLVAFERGNVAVLIQISSRSNTPIDSKEAAVVAQFQYAALPSNGVVVSSNGLDIELVLLWVLFLAALVFCIIVCIRRKENWRAPFALLAEAFGRRKLALGVSVLAVVGAMAFSMVDSSLLHGVGQWYEAGYNDFWRSWTNASYMTYAGGYGHIYVLDQALETAPAWLALIAPISRLGFGLSFPDPSVVLYPTAYWLAGPVFLCAMAFPMCAGDRFMQYLGVVDMRRRLTVLTVLAITLPPIALFGHSEDMIALGAMLYGLISALEGRTRAAGWWLGFALAFQFLAFLAVPIALVLMKRRQWIAAIIPMLVVPLIFLAVPLATEASATIHQLIHQQVFFDMGFISPTWYLDPGVGAFIRILVALAAIPAAFVLARFLPEDRKTAANMVLWTLALLFALRVAEPELVPYFLAPTLGLFPLAASRGVWWRLLAASALSVWLTWWLHDPVNGRWLEWFVILGQLAVLAWLAWPPLALETGKAKSPTRKPSAARTPTKNRAPAKRPTRKPAAAKQKQASRR
jgi:hypothetical protein